MIAKNTNFCKSICKNLVLITFMLMVSGFINITWSSPSDRERDYMTEVLESMRHTYSDFNILTKFSEEIAEFSKMIRIENKEIL